MVTDDAQNESGVHAYHEFDGGYMPSGTAMFSVASVSGSTLTI